MSLSQQEVPLWFEHDLSFLHTLSEAMPRSIFVGFNGIPGMIPASSRLNLSSSLPCRKKASFRMLISGLYWARTSDLCSVKEVALDREVSFVIPSLKADYHYKVGTDYLIMMPKVVSNWYHYENRGISG